MGAHIRRLQQSPALPLPFLLQLSMTLRASPSSGISRAQTIVTRVKYNVTNRDFDPDYINARRWRAFSLMKNRLMWAKIPPPVGGEFLPLQMRNEKLEIPP